MTYKLDFLTFVSFSLAKRDEILQNSVKCFLLVPNRTTGFKCCSFGPRRPNDLRTGWLKNTAKQFIFISHHLSPRKSKSFSMPSCVTWAIFRSWVLNFRKNEIFLRTATRPFRLIEYSIPSRFLHKKMNTLSLILFAFPPQMYIKISCVGTKQFTI